MYQTGYDLQMDLFTSLIRLMDKKFLKGQGDDMGDKGKKDKGKREEQKKSEQTSKEKRKQKKIKRN